MVIIYPGICCAICEKVISDELLRDNDYVATTHFVGRNHELWRFKGCSHA